MNDFELLGLNNGASVAEAKAAWRGLVKDHHPDKAADKEKANQKLASINAAFDRIKGGNPQMRSEDRTTSRSQSGKRSPFGFADFDAEDRQAQAKERARQETERQETGRREKPQSSSYTRSHEDRNTRYTRSGNFKDPRSNFTRTTSERTETNDRAQRGTAKQEEMRRKTEQAAERMRSREQKAQSSEPLSMNFTKEQAQGLHEALEKRKKQEAYKAATQARGGIYGDPRQKVDTNRGDIPSFHAADHIVFRGRTMEIHLAGKAKEGRNIVAMPEMSMPSERSVRTGEGFSVFEVGSKGGLQSVDMENSKNPVKGAKDLNVKVVFDSERVKQKAASKNQSR